MFNILKVRVFLAISLVVLLSGCWSKNFDEPGMIEVQARPTEAVLAGAFARVWAATQTVMGKFTVVQRDLDANSQRAYLVTDWTRGKSDRLYHGFDANRIPYNIRYRLYLYVIGEGAGTRVTIRNEEQYLDDTVTAGVDFNGSVQRWITTETSTIKENALLVEIDKLVRDPKFTVEAAQ